MATTSATGGFLSPVGSQQEQGHLFDRLIQQVIVGITGLAGELVRPRWQPKPPPQPPAEADWAAFGIDGITADTNPSVVHDPNGNGGAGVDILTRDEVAAILVSFYGPNAHGCATTLRDGFGIHQNLETLFHAECGLVRVGAIQPAGDIVNQQIIRRVDFRVWLRRRVKRVYAVRNVLSAEGVIATESVSQNFTVER